MGLNTQRYMAVKSIHLAIGSLLLIVLCCKAAVSQQSEVALSDRYQNRFGLSLTAFAANRLVFEPSPDAYLDSRRAVSGEIALNYDFYQTAKFYTSVGFGIGIIPFSFKVDVPANQLVGINSPYNDANFYSYEIVYLNFPISITYIFARSNKLCWQFTAGASYSRIYWDAYVIERGLSVVDQINDENYQLFNMSLSDTISPHHFNILGGLSTSWETTKGRSWAIGFVSQFGLRPVGTGDFKFTNVSVPSSGTVKLGFSYIGIRTVYGFRSRRQKVAEASKTLAE
jgi:hypothetical protein